MSHLGTIGVKRLNQNPLFLREISETEMILALVLSDILNMLLYL